MKIALIALAAVAISSSASAQVWQKVGETRETLMGMRTDTIDRTTPQRAFAHILLVNRWPDGDGNDYAIAYVEYDCWTADRYRNVTISAFKNRRVPNGVFDNFDWHAVYPGTLAEDAFKLACRQRPLNHIEDFVATDPHEIADGYISDNR